MTEQDALLAAEQLVNSFLSLPSAERERRAEEAIAKLFEIGQVLESENPYLMLSDATIKGLTSARVRIRTSFSDPGMQEKLAMFEFQVLRSKLRDAVRNTRPNWMKGERSMWVFF